MHEAQLHEEGHERGQVCGSIACKGERGAMYDMSEGLPTCMKPSCMREGHERGQVCGSITCKGE